MIVAVKVPLAFASLPFGRGRSCAARSVVFTAAAMPTWSRISPAGLVGVCTFTYARPVMIASVISSSIGCSTSSLSCSTTPANSTLFSRSYVKMDSTTKFRQSALEVGPGWGTSTRCTCL